MNCLNRSETQLDGTQAMAMLMPALKRLTEKCAGIAHDMLPATGDDSLGDLAFWVEALRKTVAEHEQDRVQRIESPDLLRTRLNALAGLAREMALGMDFAFLIDEGRKLLSIGYSQDANRLDVSCYDLLASEARLASLFAIAKGDVSTRHWFRLGRTAAPLGNGSALISWSGSMFEYLMPSLIMRAPAGSLLEQTNSGWWWNASSGLRPLAGRAMGRHPNRRTTPAHGSLRTSTPTSACRDWA
ncbi:hypothetical protein ACU4GD_37720 [Cupriavidus basilensis]